MRRYATVADSIHAIATPNSTTMSQVLREDMRLRPDYRAIDCRNAGSAGEGHCHHKLSLQEGDDACDPGLARRTEPKNVRPSDQHGAGSKRQCFQYIGAAPDAAIDQHRNAAIHLLRDPGEGINGSGESIQVAPSVIGDDHPRNTG